MFETEKHDMEFGVFRAADRKAYQKKDWVVVEAKQRYMSHISPENGTVHCTETGVCKCGGRRGALGLFDCSFHAAKS